MSLAKICLISAGIVSAIYLIKKYVVSDSNILILGRDEMLRIGKFLKNKEKLQLTMTCKSFDTLKYHFLYATEVNVKIAHLPYFDNFTKVIVYHSDVAKGTAVIYPKNVSHVRYFSYAIPGIAMPGKNLIMHLRLVYRQQ